tara:strand:- start:2913 stop:3125 length:213 start_codon:yes stop_codon:yes gene_type:complete
MSLRTTLKKQGTVYGRRWVIKRHPDNTIREVKLIFNPKEYEKIGRSKPMVGDRVLLQELEKNYEKKKDNS